MRWVKEFKDHGIHFKYFKNWDEIFKSPADIAIIDSRFLKDLGLNNYEERKNIFSLVRRLKKNVDKVVFFDSLDGTGSKHFWIIGEVDIFLKKQILKEKSLYTNEFYLFYKIWLSNNLKSSFKNNTRNSSHLSCPTNELDKIKVGWNIGLGDFRLNSLLRFLPGVIKNSLFGLRFFPENFSVNQLYNSKDVFLSFRGGYHSDPIYDYQRGILRKMLVNIDFGNDVLYGEKISKLDYIYELKKSKVIISPYGWGEICYRDFEALLYGSLLLKPDMSHLETYPNVYQSDLYVPLNWDLSNLEYTIVKIRENWGIKYKDMASLAQRNYVDNLLDFNKFYIHLKSNLF